MLPHRHPFAILVIQHFHHRQLHADPRLVQAAVQQQFCILRTRDAIRLVIGKCVECRRQRATTAVQLMGNLPAARVSPAAVFQKLGLDYAGPFSIRDRGRGKVTFKCYVCVFVCMCTKAVHLEPVSALSTDAFLAAFRRFTARRGIVSDLYSDCGTNFVGADRELKELLESAAHNEIHQLADQQICWHFNPRGPPHQGGLWELAVKQMKYHLR